MLQKKKKVILLYIRKCPSGQDSCWAGQTNIFKLEQKQTLFACR